jgi:small subunit ribosomal protein S21|tara:strand:- start:532 stop:882 length:351 start_codon:yes stop_codon:yes gene_type:complete
MSERKEDNKGNTRSGKPIRNYRKRADFILEGRPNGVKVPSADKDDLEKALKVFKRQMRESGIFEELREKRYYDKPSAKRYKAKSEAKRHQAHLNKRAKQEDKGYKCWVAVLDGHAI